MPPLRLVSPEDLRSLVSVSDPQISPDGHTVAFVRKRCAGRNQTPTEIMLASATGARRTIQLTAGPRDSMPRWSPDGRSLLFVRAREQKVPQLALLRLDSILRPTSQTASRAVRRIAAADATLPAVRTLTSLPEGSMAAVEWSPDGTQVAFSWRRTMDQLTTAAASARRESGASTPPLVIDDPWYRLDGDGTFGAARYRLFVLDLSPRRRRAAPGRRPGGRDATQRTPREVLALPHLDDFTFDWSPDGRMIAVTCNRDPRALFHPERAEIVLVDPEGRWSPRAIAGLPSGPKSHGRWSPDGRAIAWAGRQGRSSMYDTANVELWCAEITGGIAAPRALRVRSLTAADDACLGAGTLSDTADASSAPWFRWAPDGRSIFMRIGWHGAGRIASVGTLLRDGRGAEGARAAVRPGGGSGDRVTLHTDATADLLPNSVSADGLRIACVRSAPTEPPEIATAEVLGRFFELSTRTSVNAAYRRSRRFARPTEHWIGPRGTQVRRGAAPPGAARHGAFAPPLGVHTWVLRPPRGASDRRGAAVLEIHGGPHAQYGATYFHEFQVLAAAGYTVVYSNPRGSKGYGARFCGAIRGRWGTADWDDVRAVTRFMTRLPTVNAARLGIMGGSYGGYMTNWAIAHSRAYRAAITDRCVSDLASMCGTSDFYEIPDLYWKGVSWDRPGSLRRSSPITFFKGVRTPTLIIHSEGDLRCNIEQAEQVHAALVTQGVPTRFVRYPRETSHGMSRVGPVDLRIHRLREILRWWETHLG